jgi:hypothetical protein
MEVRGAPRLLRALTGTWLALLLTILVGTYFWIGPR